MTRPRQPSTIRTLRAYLPDAIALDRLSDWAVFWRDETLPEHPENPLRAEFDAEAEWLQHVLDRTRDLLLAFHIPCLDPVHLKSWYHADADGRPMIGFDCAAPALENLRTGTFRTAFGEALYCVAYMMQLPPETKHREALWEHVKTVSKPRILKDNPVSLSTLRVVQAAWQDDVPAYHLGLGVYQLGQGSAARRISRSSTDADPQLGLRLSSYKNVTARLLLDAGLPGARHELVTTQDRALRAAEQLGWPVVVKPADADRGEGITLQVMPETLGEAFDKARAASPNRRVLIEQPIPGMCHRIFISGGDLLYVLQRNANGVTGDGTHNVKELVALALQKAQETPPWVRKKTPKLDDLARARLAADGRDETYVPKADEIVDLRWVESTEDGGRAVDKTDTVHPENIRIAIAAARACGLTNAGVDIISPDISVPWYENGAAINEVNFAPLFGGSEVARSKLSDYLRRIIPGSGRIPIEVFAGRDAALKAARARVGEWTDAGLQACLVTQDATHMSDGTERPTTASDVAGRTRALMLSPDVDAIALVVSDDALLQTALPVDRIDRLEQFEPVTSGGNSADAAKRRSALDALLKGWVGTSGE